MSSFASRLIGALALCAAAATPALAAPAPTDGAQVQAVQYLPGYAHSYRPGYRGYHRYHRFHHYHRPHFHHHGYMHRRY